jgi:hypothetical protein
LTTTVTGAGVEVAVAVAVAVEVAVAVAVAVPVAVAVAVEVAVAVGEGVGVGGLIVIAEQLFSPSTLAQAEPDEVLVEVKVELSMPDVIVPLVGLIVPFVAL